MLWQPLEGSAAALAGCTSAKVEEDDSEGQLAPAGSSKGSSSNGLQVSQENSDGREISRHRTLEWRLMQHKARERRLEGIDRTW